MISLNIDKLSAMSKEDAAALRAIADVYHPVKAAVKVAQREVVDSPAPTKLSAIGSPVGTLTMGSLDIGAGSFTVDAAGATTASNVSVADQFLASVTRTAERTGATARIHPNDNPATGAPDQHALADKVFSGGVIPASENLPDPVSVFSHGSAELDADAVKLEAIAGPGAAGLTAADVFSGGGLGQPAPNVPAAIPTPPPLPIVTPQTSLPPLPAAPTASLPPPPPPAPAPAPASAAALTTPAVQTDKDGLPWDSRIHAGTKTMTAKGVWTRRRGVTDELVAEVETQLRAAMDVQAPPPAPSAWPFPTDSSSVTGAPTFPTLMQFITERIGDKRLTQEQVTAAVQAVGLESLNLVMARVDLVPAVLAELRKVAP